MSKVFSPEIAVEVATIEFPTFHVAVPSGTISVSYTHLIFKAVTASDSESYNGTLPRIICFELSSLI